MREIGKESEGKNIQIWGDWETEAKVEGVKCGSATESLGGPVIDCQETLDRAGGGRGWRDGIPEA